MIAFSKSMVKIKDWTRLSQRVDCLPQVRPDPRVARDQKAQRKRKLQINECDD